MLARESPSSPSVEYRQRPPQSLRARCKRLGIADAQLLPRDCKADAQPQTNSGRQGVEGEVDRGAQQARTLRIRLRLIK